MAKMKAVQPHSLHAPVPRDYCSVMAGLVPAIHVLRAASKKDVDARDKPGHDE
jgi:hypothetical protein